MIQSLVESLTLDSFLKQPETKPAREYIDGQIIQKPMPQGKHSVIQTQLSTAINTLLTPQKIAWAFCELRCTFGGRSTVPDISVFVWSRIPCEPNGEIANIFSAAPDWTIEILSPEQSQTRVTKNILHCLQYNTQMGWLIDPQEQTVLVYLPPKQIEIFDRGEETLPVPPFARDIRLSIGELFGWLRVQ